jgi:hypothetical protein
VWSFISTGARVSLKLDSREGSWQRSLGLGRLVSFSGLGSSRLGGGGLLVGLLGCDFLLPLEGSLLLGLLWGGLGGLLDLSQKLALAGDSLLLLGGVLGSAGISLGNEVGFTGSIGLHLVDGLNQDALVLELVTLGAEVEPVVDVLVDLLGVTVLAEQASQNADSAHPQDVSRHTGIAGTLSLTLAGVATYTNLSVSKS